MLHRVHAVNWKEPPAAAHPDGAEVGVNVNRLLPSGPGSYEPYSSMAFMVGIPVDIVRR